jgi:hypothetical protein
LPIYNFYNNLLVQNYKPLISQFLYLISKYFGTEPASNIKFFKFLLSKKMYVTHDIYKFSFFVYNFTILVSFKQLLLLFYYLFNNKKKVAFITDSASDRFLNISALNFLIDPKFPYYKHKNLLFYNYTSSYIVSLETYALSQNKSYWDLLFFCLPNYNGFRAETYYKITLLTAGIANSQTNPVLFDYFIPMISNYTFTINLIREIIIINFNKNNLNSRCYDLEH